MYSEWKLTPQYQDILARAGDISAAIRAADNADWDLDEEIPTLAPFDPFADDPE